MNGTMFPPPASHRFRDGFDPGPPPAAGRLGAGPVDLVVGLGGGRGHRHRRPSGGEGRDPVARRRPGLAAASFFLAGSRQMLISMPVAVSRSLPGFRPAVCPRSHEPPPAEPGAPP